MNQNRVEPAVPTPASQSQTASAPPTAEKFVSDAPSGPDLLGTAAATQQVAELLAHAETQTPLTIGLFGSAGSGKSHLLSRVISTLATLTEKVPLLASSPFLGQIAVVRLSAPDIVGQPAAALAASIYAPLANGSAGVTATEFVRDAVYSSSDPQAAARDAAERLDETRRRLDGERRALTDLDGRRARLIETVLYESAGSRVDEYARSNRTRLEARLRVFGFTGDPIQTYKDLVRDYAERSGPVDRVRTFLRMLWAYEGQTALIVWTILFFLIAWGLGYAAETQATWIQALGSSAEAMAPVANWIRQHISWLGTLRTGALAIALLCLATNLWRAIRFMTPLMRGATLLRSDLDARRGDIDSQLAHQTRRVDMLASEVDAESKRLAEAERRARGNDPQASASGREAPFLAAAGNEAERQSQAFLKALSRSLAASASKPMRLVVCLDDLELVPAQAAAHLVESTQRLLAHPNIALVLCTDAGHLAAAWGSVSTAAAHFERLIQIPLCIDAGTGQNSLSAYAIALLQPGSVSTLSALDPSRSSLDEPMTAEETSLIAGLAPVAGTSPRAVKRFINIYRLARTRTQERSALALMLALDLGGTSGELAALGAAMDEHAPDSEIRVHPGEPRLTEALQMVARAQGRNLTVSAAQAGWHIARHYRIPV